MEGGHKLDKYCSVKERYAIRGLFDESYDLTNQLYQKVKWLGSTTIGEKGIHADILRGAISHIAKLFCQKGILPYQFIEPPNTIGNCNYIALHGSKAIILPCRVEKEEAIPRYSIFRHNYTEYYNTGSLFPEIQEETIIKYIAATYGDNNYYEFQFGRVGIPGNREWIDSIPLTRGPYKTFATNQEKEKILVEVKEQISEGINDDE